MKTTKQIIADIKNGFSELESQGIVKKPTAAEFENAFDRRAFANYLRKFSASQRTRNPKPIR